MIQTLQQILKLLDQNWRSFFKSIEEWNNNKDEHLGRLKLSKYKKKNGRNIIIFTNQNCKSKDRYIKIPKIMNKQKLTTKISGKLQQVRIIPKRSITS
ncbi:Probable transposase [Caloranaerobacter azorensis DSM 13643]|uniref:Probable transposase n=1 Tax=Caloranaerobacter azorensis DSM 13643 TaxID=1121264 RepID=A0A1M5VPQ0_9FIRM|nr:hypothetical protein [Caloranaerobacter azorensis]SHH77207.1 Probable transposase [Caloranaerobacter azorensis DSM 13643]